MPNRYVCTALQEMRAMINTMVDVNDDTSTKAGDRRKFLAGRFLYLRSLMEEMQTYVNRMEDGLGDKWDMQAEQEILTNLKKERRKLEKKIKKLKEKAGE